MLVCKMVVVAGNTNSMICQISLKPLVIFLVAGCLVAVVGAHELKKAVMYFVRFLSLYLRLPAAKAKPFTFGDMKNAQPAVVAVQNPEPHHSNVNIAVDRARSCKALESSGFKQPVLPAVE
jgi:hypothetical protein